MASAYAVILAEQYAQEELHEPTCISEIEETNPAYFMVYNGAYLIAEGSLLAIKYKLPLLYFDMPFKTFEKNPQHPRIVTIRF